MPKIRISPPLLIVTGLTLLGAWLRLKGLDVQSLWWDEIFSMKVANPTNSFADIQRVCKETWEPSPSTFYHLLHGWMKLTGYNDVTGRLFVALWGIAAIPVMHLLGRELKNAQTGYIAAGLTAINYFHLYYSQEVRIYSMLFFLAVLSYYFLLRCFASNRWFYHVGYALSLYLLLSLHHYGLLILATQGFTWFSLKAYETVKHPKQNYRLPLAFALVTLAYKPFIALLKQNLLLPAFWIPRPEPDFFIDYFKDYFGAEGNIFFLALIGLLLFLFSTLWAVDEKETLAKKHQAYIVLLWMLAPLLIMYLRSINAIPALLNRHSIIVLPAILLGVAIGFSSIKQAGARWLLCAVVAVLSFNYLFYQHKYYSLQRKDEFKTIVQFMAAHNRQGTMQVVSDKNWHFQYYFNQNKLLPQYIDHAVYTDARFYTGTYKNRYSTQLIEIDTTLKNIWIISAHVSGLQQMRAVKDSLLQSKRFAQVDSFEGKDAFAVHLLRW